MHITANGINDAWLKTLFTLQSLGQTSAPRGKKIKEIKNFSVEIKDPQKRVLSLPVRRISLPFAFGELLWYLSARNDVEMMTYYSKGMKNFSDDGKTLNSAYGYRIFGKHPAIPFDQWKFVVNKLKEDSDSRQAIIHLHTPNNKPTKDEVCTLTLQFFIRDGKLDMVTNMRSNDLVKGFTYDVFSFTTFQELMANELGVRIGTYYHNAASMHIYEPDFHFFKHLEVYDELLYTTQYDTKFSYHGLRLIDTEWLKLNHIESMLRTSERVKVTNNINNPALKVMGDIFNLYKLYRIKGEKAVLKELGYDNLYHVIMRNYISKCGFDKSALLFVDGPDGAGKSTFINPMRDVYHVIHFDKPTKDFNKLIYFQTALLTGLNVCDRFYYSEWVYAIHFGREPRISYYDLKIIERLLNYRKATYLYMDTPAEVCHSRLDEEDRKVLSLEKVKQLQEAYLITFRASDVKDKHKHSSLGELK